MHSVIDLPLSRLRRIDLDRQGLLKRAAFGRGLPGTRRAIERLGYVQIDTISVVNRAHDHVLHNRVPGYRPAMIERLQADGTVFEYWAHAAAYLPMRDYRFALPRMQAMRARSERWVRSRDDALMRRVLDRVRAEGPLQTRDFEARPGASPGAGWWDWKPAKRALEQLFMQGDLMVVGRRGFQKVYDLTERVLPAWVDTRTPTLSEYAGYLVDRQLAAHGVASVRSCCHLLQTPGLRSTVAQTLAERQRDGALIAARIGPGRDPWYVLPDVLDGRAPPAPERARLLSPFDNLIIQRHRGQALFEFDYQLECYVPASKRRFGYFCLPILYRDGLVGRADCKAHRQDARLAVQHLYIEHAERLGRDADAAAAALAGGLAELAAATGCGTVDLGRVTPAQWRPRLAAACARIEVEP
ncbi:MAG: crosslink repair DNA glycosylase YcaQ family protein [Pseudomonadales bacterium]